MFVYRPKYYGIKVIYLCILPDSISILVLYPNSSTNPSINLLKSLYQSKFQCIIIIYISFKILTLYIHHVYQSYIINVWCNVYCTYHSNYYRCYYI